MKNLERHAAPLGRRDQAIDSDVSIESDQAIAVTQRAIERAFVAQQKGPGATTRNRGGFKRANRIARMRRAVVGDPWRSPEKIAEVHPAAALLLDVEVIGLLANLGAHRLA